MTSKSKIQHSMVVESTATAVLGVCKKIMAELGTSGFSQNDVFAIHLALEEALTNSVKHGNKMDPTKKVTVDYCIDANKFEVTVTDEGKGFDPAGVPDPRCGNNIYKADGRGLLLIRSYMDEVKFSNSGNSIHMVRRKGKTIPK
jgi:serine/threonine-protein kinase RsbW